MKLFKSKIDRLVSSVRTLEIKKQKAEDIKNKRSSAIGRKMAKLEDLHQIYEDKAQVILNETQARIAEYDREIKKAKKQIKTEKEYYDDVIFDEQRRSGKHE